MATKLWEQEIDKTVDWGNADGLGTPVSGQYVQKFIKDTLAKKFGYLYFDRTALKYYIFADEDDYNEYTSDPIANESLLLATFDAPSPADINIVKKSLDNVTTLLTAKNRKITFNYFIVDKSNNPVAENVSLRAVISRGGEQQTFTDNIKPDTTIDKTVDPDNTTANYADKNVGTSYALDLDDYLTNEGTYTITITLTGLNTQASTTLTFFYTVVNLELSLDNFKYYLPFDSNEAEFRIPFTAEGAAGIPKTIEILIDGEKLVQTGLGYRSAISYGDSIGTNGKIDDNLILYNKDTQGNIVKWEDAQALANLNLLNVAKFKPGKHNIQVRISIPGDGEAFYSKTKYFEFVVLDNTATTTKETYLLYATEGDPGTLFAQNEPITISGQQYTGISLSVAAIDSQNRRVPVKYEIDGTDSDFEATIEKTIENNSLDLFTYRFDTADTFNLTISPDTSGSFSTNNNDSINVIISIEKFEMENETIEESLQRNLRAKYTALNRGNGETNKDVWVNTSEETKNQLPYQAIFHNVLWNEQSGWDGEALVLKNGATVELPIDLFEDIWDPDFGFTFEIDFETFNVQDDDAIIMDYRDVLEDGVTYSPQNTSYLNITATSASLRTMKGESLKTNFKDSTRNKIAFSFNPTGRVEAGVSYGSSPNPNLLMIYVNGVLDRAGKWGDGTANSDTIKWGTHNLKTVKIGNTSGAAAVKIYSIRIYNRAFEPEDAFMNYVVDQGSNIPKIMKKNAIYDADKNISLELVKAMIPTAVISTDFTMLNNCTNKKDNSMYEMQFYDPTNPTLNFYVRNGWMSLQGTSSMQYPTKNLRPYFNKQATDKTKPFGISSSEDATTLSNQGIEVAPCFNTEFWPVSEYAGNEESVATYVDNEGILPYSVNKKEITKDKYFSNAYHEIGMGLSNSYKINLAQKYAKSTDIYWQNGTRTVESDGKTSEVPKFDIIRATESETVNQQIDRIVNAGNKVYISAYRPLLRTGWEIGSDEYWKYIKQLRWSGQKLFTKKAKKDENGVVIGYDFKDASKLKDDDGNKVPLSKNTEYYGLGAVWRQWDENQHQSGWTDKWTFKADYAESSMCHNGGIGALWGNALRNFKLNGQALGMTHAQAASNDPDYIDIRTSCDSKPIVVFAKEPIGYDMETGQVKYGAAEFKGLYNIMTDKSSTPLFGFEDIKNENNKTIWDASNVQCWEYLQNGSLLATGMSTAFDSAIDITYDKAESDPDLGLNIGENRPIFTDFEPRWPESGEAKHEGDMRWFQDDVFGTESNALETFIRWLHFCRPAVNYEVSGGADIWLDGYELSPYVHFENLAAANAWKAEHQGESIYWRWDNSGNIAYCKEGDKWRSNPNDATTEQTFEFTGNVESDRYYYFNENIDYEKVRKSVNDKKIGEIWGGEVYKVPIEGFDALNHCRDAEGNINEDEASNYLVDVYMKKQGNNYFYTDSYGNDNVRYAKSAEIDSESFEIAADGLPYSQKTFMQYFSATKYDHIDVYKVAAYFVYIMRFGAVDQVVKNCMLTTEDGQHWYFINYDNDTTLGVRNDAQLIFNWDFDRDTYDYSGNSYAYAGAKSVFWNNLTADEDFMRIVKSIDAVMYSGGLLSVKTVLEYLDERQMGTWNERLYNAQEQIKYLSTFKNNFETDKFLLFMQGTRQSHRNWWVNHRWELYDAMWSNGSYADKKVRFYLIVSDASNDAPREFMNITAASKYYFTVQKNNATIKNGFVELKAGDSATFDTRSNIAIGDPMILIGPQKLKILNFRRGAKYLAATLSLNENYQVTESDGVTKRNTTWVDEAGTMMSKLLLGDGVASCPVTNISGMNTITSLEEVDIRKCAMLTSSPSVNALTNLHRFRAAESACTVFNPATGVSLYEVSLPSVASNASGEIIKLDEHGEPIIAGYEEDGVTPIYETERVNQVLALQYLTLNNVTFMEQPMDEYQSFQDDDQLPYSINEETGELSGIYTNEDAYRYTSESKAIFDCKPTIKLVSVSFNNVKGFDTKKFVMDWKDELVRNTMDPASCTLELSNINWKDITVSELIEFVKGIKKDGSITTKFTITNFTGTVEVLSDEIDPETGTNAKSITLEEYNRIIEIFGEDVFTAGNALQITTGENIFYQPSKDTKCTPVTGKYASFLGSDTVVYEMIRGNEFVGKATIFPNDGTEYRYVLTGWNYTTDTNGKIIPATHQTTGTTNVPIAVNGTTYTCDESGVTLVNNNDGTFTFTANDTLLHENKNYVFAVSVVEVVDGVVATPNVYELERNLYIATTKRILPVARDVIASIDGGGQSATINDENVHTVSFNLGQNTNAPVKSIRATFNDSSYAPYVTIDTTGYEYIEESNILNVNFNATIPQNALSTTITFEITFETDKQNNKVNKDITLSIVPIYPETIKVSTKLSEEAEADDMTNNGEFTISQTGTYRFNIDVVSSTGGEFNVPIIEKTISDNSFIGMGDYNRYISVSEIMTDEEGDYFTVTITPPATFKSFTYAEHIEINYTDKYSGSPISFKFDLYESIIYPDNIYLGMQDYINSNLDSYIQTGSNTLSGDIYLMNGQGTTGSKPIVDSSQSPVLFKILADKVEFYSSNGIVLKDPTEHYTITISDVVVPENQGLTATVVTGDHGNDTLRLSINPIPNYIGTNTITGKYTLTYDVDRDSSTNNDVIKTENFSITIHYSIAETNTYKKLAQNQYYLVDEECNYYAIPDCLDIESENYDVNNVIATAIGKHIKFIGIGYLNIVDNKYKPHFIMFNTSEYDEKGKLYPANVTINTEWHTRDNKTIYDVPGVTDDQMAFPGYYMSSDWITTILGNLNGWQDCNFYKIWNLNIGENIKTYLPTVIELTATFGTTRSFIDMYDEVLAYMKSLGTTDYDGVRFIYKEVADETRIVQDYRGENVNTVFNTEQFMIPYSSTAHASVPTGFITSLIKFDNESSAITQSAEGISFDLQDGTIMKNEDIVRVVVFLKVS